MDKHTADCADAAATEKFGEHLGKQLQGGEIIELVGDVGSGKTTFMRGLARGLDSSDHVTSPTFTLSQIYNGRLTLHHLDLYRLQQAGLVTHQLAELLEENPKAVFAVEWADSIAGILPDERIVIQFLIQSGEGRRLTVTIPERQGYIRC